MQYLLLILVSLSYITGIQFNSIFYFDLFMLLYICINMIFNKNDKILTPTSNLMRNIMFILIIPLFLSLFADDIVESGIFIFKYIFISLIIALFINVLILRNHLHFFLKTTFYLLIINSVFYLIVYIYDIDGLYFKTDIHGTSFSINSLTVNEMGHYLVLMFFINYFYFKDNIFNRLFIISAYILTLSKTIWLQILCYFIIFDKKTLFFIIFLILGSLYYFDIVDFIYNLSLDFGSDVESNRIRIEMINKAFINLPNTIFKPAFHSINNIDKENLIILSAHNLVASYITNFGLLSFLILILVTVYYSVKNIKRKGFNIIYVFIFLDIFGLFFQPLINITIVYLPLFIYIFFIMLNIKRSNLNE